MPLRRDGRPPLSLTVLILGITLVPLATLMWLGARLLAQDRQIEIQQTQQRVEAAAERVVAALQRAVSSAEQRMAAGEESWPAGAAVVTFHDNRLSVVPNHALAFYPEVDPQREAPETSFAEADEFEYFVQDRARAIETLRALAGSADPAVRATARFRLAHLLQADGRRDAALAAYAELTGIDDVSRGGTPIALAARYRRCLLLAEPPASPLLSADAERLAGDLRDGRWALTEPVYRLYAQDAAKWSNTLAGPRPPKELLAEAVRTLWAERQSPPRGAARAARRDALSIDGRTITVLWQAAGGPPRALVATPEFVESWWLAAAAPEAREQQVSFAIGESERTDVPAATRTAAKAQLPWGITVTSLTPPGASPEVVAHRQLIVAGLGVLVVMALMASYFIVRAVSRELAVARLQSDFVAAVSHEFRTPLTSLRQFTEMLRDGSAPDDARRQVCYDAQSRSADRLTHLVESLLDFGRMEADAQPYHFASHDCAAIVERVVAEFNRQAGASGHQVHFRRAGSGEVDADPEALTRALWNLLDNAVKYSPDHRTVEVTIDRQPASVSIAVRDEGIGVPAGERAAIFDRFHRGDEARTRGIRGTGIGLAMVAHIIKAHRGRVDVASEVGRGSTFTIVLQRQNAPEALIT